MRAIILTLAFCGIAGCGNAQQKIEKEMEQEMAKLEELIRQKLSMVTQYPSKPAYYLQVNKTGCRLLVRVNDIPLGYHFTEDEGESMLYPINDMLFGSGEHTVSIGVYPLSTEEVITKDVWVNLKVVHFKEKHASMDEAVTLEELDLPVDIGTLKTPFYTDSLRFNATLPFNHKQVLAEAVDLRKVPDLEKKVLAHYNKVRNMMIRGEYYEYVKSRLAGTWIVTEMNYLGEGALRKTYLSSNAFFRFKCNLIDWIIIPIEDYEMVVCGNGKLVYLHRKAEMDNILRAEFYGSEEKKEKSPHKRSDYSSKFIALYMPKGSDELIEIY